MQSNNSLATVLVADVFDSEQVLPKGTNFGLLHSSASVDVVPLTLPGITVEVTELDPSQIRTGPTLVPNQTEEIQKLLFFHRNAFPMQVRPLCKAEDFIMNIDTGNNFPVHSPPYHTNLSERTQVQLQLDEMLQLHIIEPCFGLWASPVLLVPKKNKELRFVVNYQKVNGIAKKMAYHLPRIDDILDLFAGCTWFTTLDMKSGYHRFL